MKNNKNSPCVYHALTSKSRTPCVTGDLCDPVLKDTHMTSISMRLHRCVPVTDKPLVLVDMVSPKLHNNPDAGYSHASTFCGDRLLHRVSDFKQ